jgi:aspartate kinase
MSCGEIISAVVLSDEISKRELHAVPITGAQASIITDDNYNEASVINVDPKKLFEIIGSNKIPIVSGFQGISKSGFITTIGRGGSDVTAVLFRKRFKSRKS